MANFRANIQSLARLLLLPFCLLVAVKSVHANDDLVERIRVQVATIQQTSYPELRGVEVRIQLFNSTSDFFQARFTNTSFLGQRKLRYVLFVNRQLAAQSPPEDGLRAILAHELGHLMYFQSHCRFHLMSLARLATPSFAARFERATDLLAIERGYGEGLKLYREWLYQQIPAQKLLEKQRNYFSPVEIDALLRRIQTQPTLLERWRKRPPRSLAEIEA